MFYKFAVSTLKNKCIKFLCTFKSLSKANCLLYVLLTALVFCFSYSTVDMGIQACGLVSSGWNEWTFTGSMP